MLTSRQSLAELPSSGQHRVSLALTPSSSPSTTITIHHNFFILLFPPQPTPAETGQLPVHLLRYLLDTGRLTTPETLLILDGLLFRKQPVIAAAFAAHWSMGRQPGRDPALDLEELLDTLKRYLLHRAPQIPPDWQSPIVTNSATPVSSEEPLLLGPPGPVAAMEPPLGSGQVQEPSLELLTQTVSADRIFKILSRIRLERRVLELQRSRLGLQLGVDWFWDEVPEADLQELGHWCTQQSLNLVLHQDPVLWAAFSLLLRSEDFSEVRLSQEFPFIHSFSHSSLPSLAPGFIMSFLFASVCPHRTSRSSQIPSRDACWMSRHVTISPPLHLLLLLLLLRDLQPRQDYRIRVQRGKKWGKRRSRRRVAWRRLRLGSHHPAEENPWNRSSSLLRTAASPFMVERDPVGLLSDG